MFALHLKPCTNRLSLRACILKNGKITPSRTKIGSSGKGVKNFLLYKAYLHTAHKQIYNISVTLKFHGKDQLGKIMSRKTPFGIMMEKG